MSRERYERHVGDDLGKDERMSDPFGKRYKADARFLRYMLDRHDGEIPKRYMRAAIGRAICAGLVIVDYSNDPYEVRLTRRGVREAKRAARLNTKGA